MQFYVRNGSTGKVFEFQAKACDSTFIIFTIKDILLYN